MAGPAHPPTPPRARLTARGRAVVVFGAVGLIGVGSWTWSNVTSEVAVPAAIGSPTAAPSPSPEPPPGWAAPRLRELPETLAPPVEAADGQELAGAMATALVAEAPLAVLVDDDDRAGLPVATWLALRLRAPLLHEVDALGELATRTVVAVGDVDAGGADDVRRVRLAPRPSPTAGPSAGPTANPTTSTAPTAPTGPDAEWLAWVGALGDAGSPPASADLRDVRTLLDSVGSATTPDPAAILVRPDDAGARTAAITALALGHTVVPVVGDDPRGDPAAGARLASTPDGAVVPVGSTGRWSGLDQAQLGWQIEVARAGHQLPGGGQLLLPGRRLVALYGSPGTGALGVLGEQDVDAAIERAREQAAAYRPFSAEPVVPAFEIIATVASGGAEPTGDYSRRVPHDVIERWVDAAGEAGVYVVLDLQPGRTDFLTQAKELEHLLSRPHVGLALDPEWRLGPGQVHLNQIGSVGIDEVNAVSAWLAELTRAHALPQKLLLLHQFKLSMLRDRARLQARPELATVIQMDGQGGQGVKLDTWRAIRLDPPPGVLWGWKNFHDEDHPTRSPADTAALEPSPVFVSYQ